MNRIAIYGRHFRAEHHESVAKLFALLADRQIPISVYRPFSDFLLRQNLLRTAPNTFEKSDFNAAHFSTMLSLGGDGTLLDCTTFVRDSGLPILGINTGRLGFLSGIDGTDLNDAIDELLSGAYMIDRRTVLKLETSHHLFPNENFALNELTVLKKDAQSMIEIHAYVDGKFLNTYWADGIIIATPTGSTAYSLSCGGPIILPNSANFIITPVAPHNLNVRPVLISDQSVITLRVKGRSENYLISLDSRSASVAAETVITVMRNTFTINLVRLKNHSFLKTLRNKLHWGLDERN